MSEIEIHMLNLRIIPFCDIARKNFNEYFSTQYERVIIWKVTSEIVYRNNSSSNCRVHLKVRNINIIFFCKSAIRTSKINLTGGIIVKFSHRKWHQPHIISTTKSKKKKKEKFYPTNFIEFNFKWGKRKGNYLWFKIVIAFEQLFSFA